MLVCGFEIQVSLYKDAATTLYDTQSQQKQLYCPSLIFNYHECDNFQLYFKMV
jgi:hypothetical protein